MVKKQTFIFLHGLLRSSMTIDKNMNSDLIPPPMASYKPWVSPTNKNMVQQMTQMDWIYLYITQDVCYVVSLKIKHAPY
jgi:hypothetical protein